MAKNKPTPRRKLVQARQTPPRGPLLPEPQYRIAFKNPVMDKLWVALIERDAAKLQEAIREGADVNQQVPEPHHARLLALEMEINDFETLHPLGFALRTGFAEGVQILSQGNANIDQCSNAERRLGESNYLFRDSSKIRLDPPPPRWTKVDIKIRRESPQTAVELINEAVRRRDDYDMMRCIIASDPHVNPSPGREVFIPRDRDYVYRAVEHDAANAMRAIADTMAEGIRNHTWPPDTHIGYDVLMNAVERNKPQVLEFLLSSASGVRITDDMLRTLPAHAPNDNIRRMLVHRREHPPAAPAEGIEAPPPAQESQARLNFRAAARGESPAVHPRTQAGGTQPPAKLSDVFQYFMGQLSLKTPLITAELHDVFYSLIKGEKPKKYANNEIDADDMYNVSVALGKTVRHYPNHPEMTFGRAPEAPAQGVGR